MSARYSPSFPSAARDLFLGITLILGGACKPGDDQATEGDMATTSTVGSSGTST